MPNVYVEGPPLNVEAKRSFARGITDAAVKAYGLPPQAIIVVIRENLPENVSIGGRLLCDASPETKE